MCNGEFYFGPYYGLLRWRRGSGKRIKNKSLFKYGNTQHIKDAGRRDRFDRDRYRVAGFPFGRPLLCGQHDECAQDAGGRDRRQQDRLSGVHRAGRLPDRHPADDDRQGRTPAAKSRCRCRTSRGTTCSTSTCWHPDSRMRVFSCRRTSRSTWSTATTFRR